MGSGRSLKLWIVKAPVARFGGCEELRAKRSVKGQLDAAWSSLYVDGRDQRGLVELGASSERT